MMENVQVVIADAHTLFRDGLKALLASIPDADVVGEVPTGDDAVALRVAQMIRLAAGVEMSGQRHVLA